MTLAAAPQTKPQPLTPELAPLLSIVIVSYESAETLRDLWPSLRDTLRGLPSSELFVVDNASADHSVEVARHLASEAAGLSGATCRAEVICNETNRGFGRANNQALARAQGQYVLLLNPDTRLEPDAVTNAIAYMEEHVDVGILGPRVLLPDGRLDAPCRRSFKTPGIYFYKLSGLARLFPKSRRFGRYYLSYLPEDQPADVDAVIGAFLLIRRTVLEHIGPFDERFFMYCEDEDWCFRAKAAGWRVVYYPQAVVWHVKGASARTRRLRMIVEWHRSIFRFHRKNLASRYSPVVNGAVYAGMGASLALAVGRAALRQWLAAHGRNRPARSQ